MNNKEEWVSQRAYSIWEHAGKPNHRDLEFWLRAEKEWDVGHLCVASYGSCPFQEYRPTTGGRHISICILGDPCKYNAELFNTPSKSSPQTAKQ